MHDNVLSMEASDTVCDVERDESPYPTEDDIQPTMPLGVELTGYRLFTTSVILGIGVPKAVYSYKGQALISTTLDWLGGMILALILFWLGVIEAKRPKLSPLFFEVDLAPPVLRFLCRPEVYLWFLSVLPLLLNTMHMRTMLDARRNHEHASNAQADVIKDRLAVSVLASSTAIFIFCKVIWSRGSRRDSLPYIINSAMWLAYCLYQRVKMAGPEEDSPLFITKIAVYNFVWLYPFTSVPFAFLDSCGVWISLLADSTLVVYLVYAEAELIKRWGIPNFPGSLYGIFFSYNLMFLFLSRFFTSVPTSWVPCFAHIWSASKAAYDRVRSTGNKAWAYVSGIGREV